MGVRTLVAVRQTPPEALPSPVQPPQPQSRCRVALLVGGPSLRDHWSEAKAAEFAWVVAVNGAALLYDCDYAVMVDRRVVERLVVGPRLPRKALVTYKAYRQRMADRKGFARVTMQEIVSVGPQAKSYTFPRALKFALQLAGGQGSVEIFGMDWTDSGHDVAGLKGCHDPNRWKQEAVVLRQVWDDSRVTHVFGRCSKERLEYINGRRAEWPG